MRFVQLVRLALGGIRRTPLRLFLTVLGVIIASGALITMLAFGIGLQRSIEAPFEAMELTSRIEVRRPSAPEDDTPDEPPEPGASRTPVASIPLDQIPILDDTMMRQFRTLPGVKLVYPEVRVRQIQLVRTVEDQVDPIDTRTTILGAPAALGEYPFIGEALVAGRFLSADDALEIVVGEGILTELKIDDPELALGQRVVASNRGLVPIEASDGRPSTLEWREKKIDLEIVGVTRGFGFGSRLGRNTGLAPIETAASFPGAGFRDVVRRFESEDPRSTEGYSTVIVRVDRVSDLESVESELRSLGYETENFLTNIEQVRRGFIVIDVLLAALGGVALLIASLGIVNTQLMSVLERKKEIAIFKAIGASDRDVRTIFLTEAGLVGVIGAVGGIALARATAAFLGFGVNWYLAEQGIEDEILVFVFPWWLLASSIAFTLVIAMISGLYPARRATRIDPIHALRGN
ncbi:MAG: ABC transporter permease [Planctomycetota bacterium]